MSKHHILSMRISEFLLYSFTLVRCGCGGVQRDLLINLGQSFSHCETLYVVWEIKERCFGKCVGVVVLPSYLIDSIAIIAPDLT